ncbi:MAG: hypothetical protein DMF93_14250 [Acidobacteria bacterium]|nr:MAG: hypothetical protein DMF93_14250 [Acidobacteriota bacterium]
MLSVGSSVARDENGLPLRVNGVHIDISEIDISEIKAVQDLRDGLVHMIVHDLRSPLTSVMGYLDLLRTIGNASTDE